MAATDSKSTATIPPHDCNCGTCAVPKDLCHYPRKSTNWPCQGYVETPPNIRNISERCIIEFCLGLLKDKDRPVGECWACGRFAKGALIHESPGTALCCKGCDAYSGELEKPV